MASASSTHAAAMPRHPNSSRANAGKDVRGRKSGGIGRRRDESRTAYRPRGDTMASLQGGAPPPSGLYPPSARKRPAGPRPTGPGPDMYSRSSEPVRLERDCTAVLVPQGDVVTLPASSIGYITQALGGSYTVFIEGNLSRIAGQDGDAIGKEPDDPLSTPPAASDDAVEKPVWQQQRPRFAPPIPTNSAHLEPIYRGQPPPP